MVEVKYLINIIEKLEKANDFYADESNWCDRPDFGYLWGDAIIINDKDREMREISASGRARELSGECQVGGKIARGTKYEVERIRKRLKDEFDRKNKKST